MDQEEEAVKQLRKEDDLKTLEEARPVVRTGIALLVYCAVLVSGSKAAPEVCYEAADLFLDKLQKDLSA